jgi:hypothetical protein
MKIVLIAGLIFSSVSFAQQQSCLITNKNNQIIIVCSGDDQYVEIGCYNSQPVCFTGSANSLVEKINGEVFSGGDNGLSEAAALDGNTLNFVSWDVGGSCEVTAKRCE